MHLSKLLSTALFSVVMSLSLMATAHESGDQKTGPDFSMLVDKNLADIAGKEVLMLTVSYKPGEVEVPHKHEAHCFVYVLEGSIIMAVKGGKELTLMPGQTFYESPDDIHTVGRNASNTQPAKFLVMMIKNQGTPPLLPLE